jgi:hypothetical protein
MAGTPAELRRGSARKASVTHDRVVAIRVLFDKHRLATLADIRDLPIRTATGATVNRRKRRMW